MSDNYQARRVPVPKTIRGIGSRPAVSGLKITEFGDGNYHRTVFKFTNVEIALADEAGVVAYGSKKIYDFPAGIIANDGSVANLAITKNSAGVNADWDGDFGLGSAAASNNATLSTTEQNFIPTTATPQAVAGATTATGYSGATERGTTLDGHTTPIDLYLNFLVDDADHNVGGTACSLIVNGTVTVFWKNLGDY